MFLFEMAKDTVQKMITFPRALAEAAEERAKKYGLLLPEYIRFLVLEQIKRDEEREFVEIADEKTEKAIGEALEDYKYGRYTVLKRGEDIDNYCDRIFKKKKNGKL
jgi:hypothetical protein